MRGRALRWIRAAGGFIGAREWRSRKFQHCGCLAEQTEVLYLSTVADAMEKEGELSRDSRPLTRLFVPGLSILCLPS